jgi:NTE family protein
VYSVREKSWGPNYLRFGFGLYDDFQGNGLYSLGIGWTTVPFAESGIEWRTDFMIGTPLRIDSELWVPLDPGLRWFVAPSGFFQKRGYDLDDDPDIRGEVQTEQWAFGADAGRIFGDWGELRVGLRSGNDSNSLHESEGGTSIQDVDIGAWIARFSWDTLDLADFPTEGTVGSIDSFANVDALGASETFESIELRGSVFTSFGATTVGFGVDAGTSFGDALPVSRSFFLGGFTRLSGTAPDSQSGDTLLLARMTAWQSLSAKRTLLGFPLFVGGTLELGSTWTEAESVDLGDLLPAGSVFLASDTPLGPAALVLGVADGDGVGFALVFGRLY